MQISKAPGAPGQPTTFGRLFAVELSSEAPRRGPAAFRMGVVEAGTGSSMSQHQFGVFMAAQIAAIQRSGMEPDVWVKRHSATFRAAWGDSHAA